MGGTNGKSWLEYLRIITPLAVLVLGFYINGMNASVLEVKASINNMQAELFHHLTNAELHIPRSTVTSKDEFIIYQAMRDKQMADIKDGLCRVESLLMKHMEK
jgi:hypothetical protein